MVPPNSPPTGSSGATAPPRLTSRRFWAELFSRFARGVSELAAQPLSFVIAVAFVLVWAASGPASDYSATWQLWINTSTTILTFLMVFLLQNSQVRDTRALHVKLDELLRAVKGARNELIDLENLPESELERYCEEFKRLHLRYAEAVKRRRGGDSNIPFVSEPDKYG